ncbi:MAG: N-acetylmuramoyl-L-alanine amidase [Acidobacteriota bacterium]
MARFRIGDDWRIPHETGQAIDRGWPAATGGRPHGVTWHWTATWTLRRCSELLGGPSALRRGQASAHCAVGRSFAEGVERYVELDDRAWHAGKEQRLRWDGRPYVDEAWKGARTTIGVETVTIGYARPGVVAGRRWPVVDDPTGRRRLVVQPWSDEQLTMMIAVGRAIVERWPAIGPRDHHGHHDLCPGDKVDVVGLPFARLLRGIYDDPSIPDVWTPTRTIAGRRRALARLGLAGATEISPEAPWSTTDDEGLRRAQAELGLTVDGLWTQAVSWAVHDALADGRLTQ